MRPGAAMAAVPQVQEDGRREGPSAPVAAAVEEVREELAKRASEEDDDRKRRQGATGWKHW